MRALTLLRELRRDGFIVSVDHGELEVAAAEGALSPELRAQLIEHKSELIRLLSELAASQHIPLIAQVSEERDHFIVSFAQQRLWFLHRLLPENPFYNVPIVWRLGGKLDVRALQASLDTL